MTGVIDRSEPFPLHCELAAREFSRFRDAKAITDPFQRKRRMRYHLEQALLNFKNAQEVLIEAANRAMVADAAQNIQEEKR